MAERTLQSMAIDALRKGPSRVMISAGEAVNSRRAREKYGVIPDVMFIRSDGWTLAAPERTEKAAYELWKDQWIGFVRRPSTEAKPIAEYCR